MKKDKFYFTGDVETIVDLFGFEKLPQSELEDSVFEYYQLVLNGYDDRVMKIDLTIDHHPEKEDTVYFELICDSVGICNSIRLDINSALELTIFINLISSN